MLKWLLMKQTEKWEMGVKCSGPCLFIGFGIISVENCGTSTNRLFEQ